jgi:hypothetical protein
LCSKRHVPSASIRIDIYVNYTNKKTGCNNITTLTGLAPGIKCNDAARKRTTLAGNGILKMWCYMGEFDLCAGATKPIGVTCNDNNPCTNNAYQGCKCVYTNNTAPCNDGNACTTGDTCVGGTCQPGSPVLCNDTNVCTTDTCNTTTGCVYTDNIASCNDGNDCTTGDTCISGTCQPGSQVLCNDTNVSTTDTCNTTTGCVYTDNTASCNDGDACTTGDTCISGTCQPGSQVLCNDTNVSTTDTCNTATGCVYTNNTAPCDDGNDCTTGDTCISGTCQPGPQVLCNDTNVSTTDTCNTATGCVYTNNTTPCDDGNDCTTEDACANGGVCRGPRRQMHSVFQQAVHTRCKSTVVRCLE